MENATEISSQKMKSRKIATMTHLGGGNFQIHHQKIYARPRHSGFSVFVRSLFMDQNKLEDEAVRLLESGKLRRAERLLKQMLVSDPRCLAAHFQLARVYRRTREFELALRHGRRTLRLNPNERNACLNLGLIYELLGRNKLAALYYKRELLHNAGSLETHWNMGRHYFKKHQWSRAAKHLRCCFEMRFMTDLEDTVDKLGICYQKLHDVRSYIELFTTYVQIVPNAAWAFVNLGRALLAMNDYKGAALRFSTAKRLGSGNSIAIDLERAKKALKDLRMPRQTRISS
jgi:tetratricopeptide (TPR) repeat protein